MKFLILCIFGRAGYEVLNNIILNNNYNFKKIIIFTHKKNNDILLDFVKNLSLEYYEDSINNYLDLIKNKEGLLLSIHYRYIIKNYIINSFKGIKVNLHPSLLPKYKGCFSSVWAIINNESETGITYHTLTEEVDSGNILIQKKIKILPEDTAFSLFNKLITLGIKELDNLFELLDNGYNGYEQKGLSSYYNRKIPYDGIINKNWDENLKKRFVRAMFFPPHKGALLINEKGEKIEISTTNISEIFF